MQDTTITEDNPRSTRSRNNSSPSAGNVIDFTRPITITTPGRYLLSNPDSGCSISLFQDVFASQLCDQFSCEIENTGALKQYTTIHKQAQVHLPRLSSWYGPVDYAFSGIVMKANSVSECPRLVAAYQHMVENLFEPNNIDCSSDCFLINQYRTGRDSCGEHSDNEPEVDLSKPVVTLSLGQQRCMLIREAKNSGNAITIKLDQGSVLVMHGTDFQKKYTHQIPKDNAITAARTSVTYRTCSSSFLRERNALSTPLTEMPITPVLANLYSRTVLAPKSTAEPVSSPSLHNRRRSSLSLSGLSQINSMDSSPVGSPLASSSPSVTSSKTSVSNSETFPLSLEAMLEAIDSLKEKTVKNELSRHGSSNSGSLIDCKKRLKKAVKACHKRLSVLLLEPPSTSAEPDCVTHSLQTMENSVIDLQAKISLQHTTLQTLVLCSDDKSSQKGSTSSPNLSNELNTVDKRLEKLEEIMSSINSKQQDTATSLKAFEVNITAIKSEVEDSKACLQSLQLKDHTNPSNKRPLPHSAQNQNRGRSNGTFPDSHRKTRKPRKVLLLHDSQMNGFIAESFSSGFKVEKMKVGSYSDLNGKHMRDVIKQPEVDCYILQLGVNDYRYKDRPVNKAVEDAKKAIDTLLSSSSAKIVVSLPTPTPGPLSDLTKQFVSEITQFVSTQRELSDLHRRLFTVNNTGNFSRAISAAGSSQDSPNPLKEDQLHVSEYGLKKLCVNIKLGLYRAFGMRSHRMQPSTAER
ncbi:uncharacterized protein LOC134811101 [Bolinopsis microptera]|uniref:uncharacterized protein LOC134811101 n=1 Tax=Bolinopsis microptera TaxID=2820187 RepID=UPI003079B1CB